jgi:hypothetical protein
MGLSATGVWGRKVLVYEALSYWCMRLWATSVWGLKLLVYEALSYCCMRLWATGVLDRKLLVYGASSEIVRAWNSHHIYIYTYMYRYICIYTFKIYILYMHAYILTYIYIRYIIYSMYTLHLLLHKLHIIYSTCLLFARMKLAPKGFVFRFEFLWSLVATSVTVLCPRPPPFVHEAVEGLLESICVILPPPP